MELQDTNCCKKKHPIDSERFQQLISYLLINYNQISDCGLMSGKMGGIIFFMIYAQKTGIELYNDYCDELFDDIYKYISTDTKLGLYNGLCGIGWGIEFLIQHDLIEGNTDDILKDIDSKIQEINPLRITDKSTENGLIGILYYIIVRMESFDRRGLYPPFDKQYLQQLLQSISNLPLQDKMQYDNLLRKYKRIIFGLCEYNVKPMFPNFMFDGLPKHIHEFHSHPIGIHKGLTGIALKNIMYE